MWTVIGPWPVRNWAAQQEVSSRWVREASSAAPTRSYYCLNHPPAPPPVHGKIVFHETGPWYQKGWGPLIYMLTYHHCYHPVPLSLASKLVPLPPTSFYLYPYSLSSMQQPEEFFKRLVWSCYISIQNIALASISHRVKAAFLKLACNVQHDLPVPLWSLLLLHTSLSQPH